MSEFLFFTQLTYHFLELLVHGHASSSGLRTYFRVEKSIGARSGFEPTTERDRIFFQ